jgi:hypothetical protein
MWPQNYKGKAQVDVFLNTVCRNFFGFSLQKMAQMPIRMLKRVQMDTCEPDNRNAESDP